MKATYQNDEKEWIFVLQSHKLFFFFLKKSQMIKTIQNQESLLDLIK